MLYMHVYNMHVLFSVQILLMLLSYLEDLKAIFARVIMYLGVISYHHISNEIIDNMNIAYDVILKLMILRE